MIKKSMTIKLFAFLEKQNPYQNTHIQILYHNLQIFVTIGVSRRFSNRPIGRSSSETNRIARTLNLCIHPQLTLEVCACLHALNGIRLAPNRVSLVDFAPGSLDLHQLGFALWILLTIEKLKR